MKDRLSEARRVVNGSNLEVSMFLASRGMWVCIAQDATGVTDEEMCLFPESDHDEILRQRCLLEKNSG